MHSLMGDLAMVTSKAMCLQRLVQKLCHLRSMPQARFSHALGRI